MKTSLPSGVSTSPVVVVRWNAGPLVHTMPVAGTPGGRAETGSGGAKIAAVAPNARTTKTRLRIGLTHHGLGRQWGALVDPYLRGHAAEARSAVVGQPPEVPVAEEIAVVRAARVAGRRRGRVEGRGGEQHVARLARPEIE